LSRSPSTTEKMLKLLGQTSWSGFEPLLKKQKLVRENVKSFSNSVTKFCDQRICEEFYFFRHWFPSLILLFLVVNPGTSICVFEFIMTLPFRLAIKKINGHFTTIHDKIWSLSIDVIKLVSYNSWWNSYNSKRLSPKEWYHHKKFNCFLKKYNIILMLLSEKMKIILILLLVKIKPRTHT